MRKNKYIIAGILATGMLAGLATSMAFAEVPNGRVDGNVPEPAEPLITVSDTTNTETDEHTPMLINETEESDAVVTSDEPNEETTVNEVTDSDESVESTQDSEPEMWPVYLSLGGIVLTLLLIFVINIAHRKSQK